jgi:hypothetical protein
MKYIILLMIAFTACTDASQKDGASQTEVNQTKAPTAEPWILVEDESTGLSSYQTKDGEIVIPVDTYAKCLTDTFYTKAIVMTKNDYKWVVIDRNQKVEYEVFPYDNGPDYPSDGLFRIIQNGKIGYADATDFKVVIDPQFDCAYPFENGKAMVSKNCSTITDGDHKIWKSDEWQFVNKKGEFQSSK